MKRMILAAAFIAAAAQGQTINRCKNPETGQIAYTSNACPMDPKAWALEFEGTGNANDRDRMSRSQAQAAIERSRRAIAPAPRTAYRSAPVAQGTVIPIHAGRCAEARKTRDRELAKLGLNRTMDALRSWDDYVQSACR